MPENDTKRYDGRPEKPQNARDATQMFMTAFRANR